MILWTAFVLGLLGSLHCLGMCGPLAMALPPTGESRIAYASGRALYNLGRVLTYGLLGSLFGLLGKNILLAGAQRWLSIAIGVIILLAVLLGPMLGRRGYLAFTAAPLARLKRALARLLHKHSTPALFGIGLLNGLLPCGLVYVALAGAATTGSPVSGFLYMAVFGLGTFPMMMLISLAGKPLQFRLRLTFQRIIPVALVTLAVLFILRGMSLGIPYISPDLSGAASGSSCCH